MKTCLPSYGDMKKNFVPRVKNRMMGKRMKRRWGSLHRGCRTREKFRRYIEQHERSLCIWCIFPFACFCCKSVVFASTQPDFRPSNELTMGLVVVPGFPFWLPESYFFWSDNTKTSRNFVGRKLWDVMSREKQTLKKLNEKHREQRIVRKIGTAWLRYYWRHMTYINIDSNGCSNLSDTEGSQNCDIQSSRKDTFLPGLQHFRQLKNC